MPTRAKYAKMTKYEDGGEVAGSKKYKRKKTKRNIGAGIGRALLKESGKSISDADKVRVNNMLGQESGKGISDADRARVNNMVEGFNGGGEVKGGTSSQMSGRHYKGIF